MTDMYLDAVRRATDTPNEWVEVPRDFKTESNASITGSCLEGGYLRVEPGEGDIPVVVQGHRYIRTAGPAEPARARSGTPGGSPSGRSDNRLTSFRWIDVRSQRFARKGAIASQLSLGKAGRTVGSRVRRRVRRRSARYGVMPSR
jgi:hypothetical protein